jgi:Ca-activated chloride channel homolog
MSKYSSAQALLSLMFAFALTACAGGGPDAPALPTPAAPAATPSIQVLPGSYDFGKVTEANRPAPLEITILNSGTAALKVSELSLAGDSTFVLERSAGSKPCGSAPTIAVADRCTVQVAFRPAGTGAYLSSLQISSDARNAPLVALQINGASEPVSRLSVQINQVDRVCPSNQVTAYVSVTDQGGYPVTGLADRFVVTESVDSLAVQGSYVEFAYKTLAVSAVMDHSGSLTGQPVAFADMKNGFSTFFNDMRTQDIGEVVKFESVVEVVQPFTSDKAALLNAVAAPFGNNGSTKLYDAAFLAVDNTAPNTGYRRAVIVATDGKDEGPTTPYSTRSLDEVIANAVSKNVAIFTIGIGGSINRTVLEQMATGTGGLFYEANTSQNLATIYQQLSSVLYKNQYMLTFNQPSKPDGSSLALTIGAASGGISGSASTTIASCN